MIEAGKQHPAAVRDSIEQPVDSTMRDIVPARRPPLTFPQQGVAVVEMRAGRVLLAPAVNRSFHHINSGTCSHDRSICTKRRAGCVVKLPGCDEGEKPSDGLFDQFPMRNCLPYCLVYRLWRSRALFRDRWHVPWIRHDSLSYNAAAR